MGTLDKVLEMQKQGISDAEISIQLRNEGISPAEINDSLNQSKIKNAVSPQEDITPAQQTPLQGMQESIMPKTPKKQVYTEMQPPTANTQNFIPNTQPMTQEIPAQPQNNYYQENPSQDNYYQENPQSYPQQDYYSSQAGINTGTIAEIAEQVTIEKLNEYKKKIGDITSFKNTIRDNVDNIDDRLKRIEKTIDKLQQAIIGKIGEFGENNAMIHKDIDNLHNTVAKLMNPLIDNYNELKKIKK